jgi:hypothetical protein
MLRFENLESRRLLVMAVSAAPNDTAASLLSYGGPGDPDLPGFDNVGAGSTGGSSVIYLGAGWVLTASHVTIANPPIVLPGGVSFGGVQYLVDTSTIHQLHNPDNSLADLKIFRIIGDPGLPGFLPAYIATAPPVLTQQVFMIGNGATRGDQHFWEVDTGQNPWEWTEVPEPDPPGPFNASGFDIDSPRRIRWGENQVQAINVFTAGVWGYTTQFDDLEYTGQVPLTHEAQASSGDSGGPVFAFVGGKWVLSGMMIAVSADLSGQPPATTLFGFQVLAADLSYYRDEILEIIGVGGRHVFYNQSAFDGNNAAIDAADASAVAPDKWAYFPGAGQAVLGNLTNFDKGITGVMVDLAAAGNHAAVTTADFVFKVGADNSPSTWTAAPPPSAVAVSLGAGDGGSDRVTITWPAGAIKDTWLEVQVLANANTGLTTTDVHFWGNLVGETASTTPAGSFARTVAADGGPIITNGTQANVGITNRLDVNKSNSVTIAADRGPIVSLGTGILTRIEIPAGGPFAPENDGAESAAVASALAEPDTENDSQLEPPDWLPPAPRVLEPERATRNRAFEQFAWLEEPELRETEDESSGLDLDSLAFILLD